MASLDHRLNPLFSIKECSSCGALYTADFCCSKGGLEDKILVPKPPQNCATCGDPVEGLYCRPCAFVRKCLNEGCFDQFQPPQFPVNYPPQATNKEILQAQEDLIEAIETFLKEYDHIPPEEKCMALLLAEKRFLKIKRLMKEEQNQPEVMQELLLKLMNDLQVLKGIQQEKEKPAAQSFTPYGNFSMIEIKAKVERRTEVTKDTVFPTNNGITEDVQPSVVPVENQNPVSEPVVAPVSAPMPNPKPSIPYPSRRNDEKSRENANEQIEKFYEIFKDMTLIGNKEKLSEMARTPLNEHCSAVILNKLPEKLGDPDRFLIPCKFPGMDECLALADLGASINLMPFSLWKKLNLPNLTPTCMTLELTDRSISPIDVYEGELTLRVDNEAITYNLDQTSRYSVNYNDMTANRIDVVELACEEYSQEVLGFSDVIASGNPTPGYDPIVSNSSPTLTPFGDSDFLLLEEADAFLALADDPTSPKVDESYYDPEGDILILEALLNSDPSPPPNQGNYLPEIRKELKICEAKTAKSSIDEPPEVELKDLPPHLEYAFLEDNNKLPVIIAKDLSVDEKTALIKVLKSRKRAIAWKLSDIKGINPEFCSHKILMEEDYEPAVQHQKRVNPKIHES
ncbi:reverse transcriptase domain-containing protein [Tanacetum coccineum]